ncbi:MAG TPA: hypothetical protein VHZ55_27650 [Bryobacteraceae bacterium]|jgi:hypothetical protein|nr:hypothetical protein [Bryobacteraceae bacterium]
MNLRVLICLGCLFIPPVLGAETLGFVEQKFSDLHFEKGRWTRTVEMSPCLTYVAQEDGAVVEVLRIGMGNLVPFKAAKGLKVIVCGSTAAFDEGFEAGAPMTSAPAPKQTP